MTRARVALLLAALATLLAIAQVKAGRASWRRRGPTGGGTSQDLPAAAPCRTAAVRRARRKACPSTPCRRRASQSCSLARQPQPWIKARRPRPLLAQATAPTSTPIARLTSCALRRRASAFRARPPGTRWRAARGWRARGTSTTTSGESTAGRTASRSDLLPPSIAPLRLRSGIPALSFPCGLPTEPCLYFLPPPCPRFSLLLNSPCSSILPASVFLPLLMSSMPSTRLVPPRVSWPAGTTAHPPLASDTPSGCRSSAVCCRSWCGWNSCRGGGGGGAGYNTGPQNRGSWAAVTGGAHQLEGCKDAGGERGVACESKAGAKLRLVRRDRKTGAIGRKIGTIGARRSAGSPEQ